MCEHLALCCRVCVERLISYGIMCDFKRIFIRRTSMTIRGLQASGLPSCICNGEIAAQSNRWCQRFLSAVWNHPPSRLNCSQLKKTFPSCPRSAQRAQWFPWPLSATFPVFPSTVLIWEQPGAAYLDLRPCTKSMLYLQQSLWWGEGMFPGSSEQLQQGRAAQYW